MSDSTSLIARAWVPNDLFGDWGQCVTKQLTCLVPVLLWWIVQPHKCPSKILQAISSRNPWPPHFRKDESPSVYNMHWYQHQLSKKSPYSCRFLCTCWNSRELIQTCGVHSSQFMTIWWCGVTKICRWVLRNDPHLLAALQHHEPRVRSKLFGTEVCFPRAHGASAGVPYALKVGPVHELEAETSLKPEWHRHFGCIRLLLKEAHLFIEKERLDYLPSR